MKITKSGSPYVASAVAVSYLLGVAQEVGLLPSDGKDKVPPRGPLTSVFVSTTSTDTGSYIVADDLLTGEEREVRFIYRVSKRYSPET